MDTRGRLHRQPFYRDPRSLPLADRSPDDLPLWPTAWGNLLAFAPLALGVFALIVVAGALLNHRWS